MVSMRDVVDSMVPRPGVKRAREIVREVMDKLNDGDDDFDNMYESMEYIDAILERV